MKLFRDVLILTSMFAFCWNSFGNEGAAAVASAPAVKTAKTVLFRNGMVYSAEVGSVKPELLDPVRMDKPGFEGETVWCELVLKPFRNRNISRFDFLIAIGENQYPCLAVAKNDDAYSQQKENWTIPAEKIMEKDFVRYLFPVRASDIVPENGFVSLQLKWTYSESSAAVPLLPFRSLPAGTPFMKVSEQPSGGSCGLTLDEAKALAVLEVRSAPVPAPAPAPAAK